MGPIKSFMFVFWTLLEMVEICQKLPSVFRQHVITQKKVPLAAEQALTFHSELGVSPCKICLSLNKFSVGSLCSIKPSVSWAHHWNPGCAWPPPHTEHYSSIALNLWVYTVLCAYQYIQTQSNFIKGYISSKVLCTSSFYCHQWRYSIGRIGQTHYSSSHDLLMIIMRRCPTPREGHSPRALVTGQWITLSFCVTFYTK